MRQQPLRVNFAKLPFRRWRDLARDVVRRLNYAIVIEGNGLIQTERGIRMEMRTQDSSAYTPPFHPTLAALGDGATSRDLTIAKGYVRVSHDDATTAHDINPHDLWPVMPVIGSTPIDGGGSSSIPSLSIGKGEKSWIYLKRSYVQRSTAIGATTNQGSTNTGVNTNIETAGVDVLDNTSNPPVAHDHDTDVHDHLAQTNLAALAYHYDTAVPPEFEVYVDGVDDDPIDTELIKYDLFGFYDLDGEGEIKETDGHEWYQRSDYSAPVHNHVTGTDTVIIDDNVNPKDPTP